jgi:hypothetical protein
VIEFHDPDPAAHPPAWWLWVRRVVIFGLGCWVVIDAMTAKSVPIWELVIGMVLIGVLPLDDLARYLQRKPPSDTDPK